MSHIISRNVSVHNASHTAIRTLSMFKRGVKHYIHPPHLFHIVLLTQQSVSSLILEFCIKHFHIEEPICSYDRECTEEAEQLKFHTFMSESYIVR